MKLHRNAKLGLAGRYALVCAIDDGLSVKAAAAAFSVSPATACRWHRRWREASGEERQSLVCLHDRSSRPRRMPRLLSAREQRRICAARRRTGWGPRLLTLSVGHPHSTISKVLRRHGLSRPARPAREPERRYEWPCPGDLLHMDVARYARFKRPGHAVTGAAGDPGRLRLCARARRRPLTPTKARSNASTKRWPESGPTASATAPLDTELQPCHTGSPTTTSADPTAQSAANPQSAAFTTSVGRTARDVQSYRSRRGSRRRGWRSSPRAYRSSRQHDEMRCDRDG
jgi:transposase